MRPSIVTQEQKFVFQEQYEAKQKIMELGASLVRIRDERKNINSRIDELLKRNRVLEGQIESIQKELVRYRELL